VEMAKYSDILDTARSKIYLRGKRYYLINSAMPEILLSLYLKPDNNNSKTIIMIRDDLVLFFGNNSWEERGRECYPNVITIEFVLEEGGEDKILYRVYRYREPIFPGYGWFEQWRDNSQDGGFRDLFYDNRGMGSPFMRKNIHNEELDFLLDKYSDIIDVEQSGGFHSGTDFIGMCIYINSDDLTGGILAGEIMDDLVVFFNNNHEKLKVEYGPLNLLRMDFYTLGGILFSYSFRYNNQNERWESNL
jgi:hypothetical protein